MSDPATRILHFQDDYRWEGVEREAYKSGHEAGRAWKDIVRQVLIGKRAEETSFHLRYFEIAPGGYSSLEKHGHAHVVIAVRGHGKVILGEAAHALRQFDTVYVSPWTPHQFQATGTEPFGFFCIVDAQRDRPVSLSLEERAAARAAGARDTP
ncbi:MAG: cupin domain-containing protein [Thermodesulfobacteriota bacterium]|jgi:quercetin dioxygenase-like cupin family protein